jgi:peptidoglycan biosynthesis protein MviN/MurJ (putative lipid II flippase)
VVNFKALALLGGIFITLPVLLFLGLQWLARRWIRTHPSSRAMSEITPAGYLFCTCLVVSLLGWAIVFTLDPTGRIGAFLHSTVGAVAALIVIFLGFPLAEAALTRLGYPLTRIKGQRDV